MSALADAQVGKFLTENFVSSFQKVATFKIVGKQKQGGNVASYFCAPDGRVLHVIPGPVDAATMLKEAKWVVEAAEKAIEKAKGDGAAFKAYFRKAHAERCKNEYGLVVEAVTWDPPAATEEGGALSYNDPSGRPLSPKLPPPPIEGPDVAFKEKLEAAAKAAAPGDARMLLRDRGGRGWVLPNLGRAHVLMAAHSMAKIETVYGSIFEGILGEKISTKPVEVVTPFPWVPPGKNDPRRGDLKVRE